MKLFAGITKFFNKKSITDGLKDGNQIIGDPKLINSKIVFEGKNNVFFTPEAGIPLYNSTIHFHGNNSIVFMRAATYTFNFSIQNDSVFYLGTESHINKNTTIVVTERKHLIIGDKCLFATGFFFRTSDAHPIYDCETNKRINHGKSIYRRSRVVRTRRVATKGSLRIFW